MIEIVWLALPLLLSATPSDPYVRTRANDTCPGASAAACLYWRAPGTVVFNQSQAGNPATPGDVFDAVSRSWRSWQDILDGCGNLTLAEGLRVPDRVIGYDQRGNNINLILFRTRKCSSPGLVPADDPCRASGDCNNAYDCWDEQKNGGPMVIALTTTTYEKCSGRILRADIELNAATYKFTTVDSPRCPRMAPDYNCVATDVRNTATHEFGHSLGLDHTTWKDPATGQSSTMSPSAFIGDTDKRVVDNGSRQFVCQVYPKDGVSRSCLPEASSGCGAAPGAPMLVAAAAWLLVLRRRSARA